ncbi:hypothetical protein PS15m_002725 [Mucor circinelloides]
MSLEDNIYCCNRLDLFTLCGKLDDFLQDSYCPKIVVVQEAFMVAETSLSLALLIYGLFVDKSNKIPCIGLLSALFVLIFRVATVGFVSSAEKLGLGKLDESSIWAHLAENIVLIVHMLMWALLCEFSIVFDTQTWRQLKSRFISKRVVKSTENEEQKDLPLNDTVSITSSLPSYHSDALPPYSNTVIQNNLPPLYEDDFDDDGHMRHDLTYPTPAYFGQHRVIWNTFITISTEREVMSENTAEPVDLETGSNTSRRRRNRSKCIVQ